MKETRLTPEAVRCRHSADCGHLEEDQCSHYTMPSLTRSKIGQYISTDYLLNIYTVSTEYLHSIYTMIMQEL